MHRPVLDRFLWALLQYFLPHKVIHKDVDKLSYPHPSVDTVDKFPTTYSLHKPLQARRLNG